MKRIVRCAAINVDPETAARDLEIPQTLTRRLGHADCGIYAEVIAGGTIAIGDAVIVSSWHDAGVYPAARNRRFHDAKSISPHCSREN